MLADAHPAVLDAVPRVLAAHQITVVATATNGDGAFAAISQHEPTVAILDPKIGGLPAIEVARQAPATRIILYTSYRDREDLVDALEAGVHGIVLKEAPLSDLVRAITTVTEGGVYIDPLLASVFITRHAKHLTKREREILRLLADGHRYTGISEQLSLAPDTVREYARRAMRKLETTTTTQAVAEALRRSLIT